MEHLAIISHNSFRAVGFHKSRSASSPYGPAPEGSQLILLDLSSVRVGTDLVSHHIYIIGYIAFFSRCHTLGRTGVELPKVRTFGKHVRELEGFGSVDNRPFRD